MYYNIIINHAAETDKYFLQVPCATFFSALDNIFACSTDFCKSSYFFTENLLYVVTLTTFDLKLHEISPFCPYVWKFHGTECPSAGCLD